MAYRMPHNFPQAARKIFLFRKISLYATNFKLKYYKHLECHLIFFKVYLDDTTKMQNPDERLSNMTMITIYQLMPLHFFSGLSTFW